jgi:hypothetical protein
VAIGAGRRSISIDDIYLAKSEKTVPKDRDVIIDLLIRPTDDSGNITDAFQAVNIGSNFMETESHKMIMIGTLLRFVLK